MINLLYKNPIIVLLLSLLLSACSVKLISLYDATLVRNLNQIQTQTYNLLLEVKQNIGSHKASYKRYIKQYTQIDAEMMTLISYVKTVPKSGITIKQLTVLQQSLDDLKHLHQLGFANIKEVDVIQQTLDDDFSAIYSLQNVKKEYLPQ